MSGYRMPTTGDMGMVLSGNSQGTLAVSAVAAQTSAIANEGYYDIWSDVDTYVKIGETANDVTTSTGYLLRADTTIPNVVIKRMDKIGAISSGSGTLRYHKVS